MASLPLSQIVVGKVLHRRHRPVENRFVYPVFYLLVNLDEVERDCCRLLGINRRSLLSVNYKDYGNGGEPREWTSTLLRQHGVTDCTGPLWLQTFPRVFGYLFNPVSFWFCTREDHSVGAVIAEVNNTFGDRHCYLLTPDGEGNFQGLDAEKVMYVSPFNPIEGYYRFYINSSDFSHPRVQIDYYRDNQLELNTAIWGKAKPLSSAAVLLSLIRQPLLTLGVIARIHWQALRLWVKGVPLCKRLTGFKEEPQS